MWQRGDNLLQLKMFLLFVRTSAVSLLLFLAAGGLVAAEERGLTCRQEIPAVLIRDLWSRNRQLITKLPKEENFSRRRRLLPRFRTKGPKRLIGWLEIRELIDVYQRSVFTRGVVQKLLPLHYADLLLRIQNTLQHCVSSPKPSAWFEIIKKVERKITKRRRRRDEGALKAVGEFIFILRWMDELTEHHHHHHKHHHHPHY
ncbi:uncharacterized protein LOC117726162 isoform X2 [Cyclopterus lumpus]|uniref:uncharacterized protein LOC117726162 isoform X2 n=1 Tax=Cyclopterus lumpus TaxID=8103 RepID=UPI00148728FC|nr:uncharacterized protein LOC117726162 isoform X2 [Cyclopterus lumpus]